MREIKFKAWSIQDKKMYKVNTLAIGYVKVDNYVDVYHNGVLIEKNRFCITEIPRKFVKVMQCTGLKDFNNKEIYEGDILAFYDDEKTIIGRKKVVWNELDASFFGVNIEDSYLRSRLAFSIEANYKVEIIGNIYENPELLKDKK